MIVKILVANLDTNLKTILQYFINNRNHIRYQ